MSYVDQVHLRKVVTDYYVESELRVLCYDLGIDYDSLGGRGKAENALELVGFALRNGYYDDLVAYVRRTRPHVGLKMSATPPTLPEAGERPLLSNQPIIRVQGDYVHGDKTAGDKVAGDKTSYNITGNVIGSAIGGGTVNAQNIAGGNITINPDPQDKAEFAQQLQELKVLLEKAIADGEFDNVDDGIDAVDDLDKAIRETGKDEPRTNQLQKRLESVAELIEGGAKVGTAVLKATPIIAGLIKAAGLLF